MNHSPIVLGIKRQCRVKTLRDGILAGHICRPISPYCSAWFIRHNFSPNAITLIMILMGIVGSILFSLPYIWSKIAGYLFWYLWFTMDLCDGEVARFTQQLSTYGKQMDYMAHLICHPLMNLSIWMTYMQIGNTDGYFVSAVFMVIISLELIFRNLATLISQEDAAVSTKKKVGYLRYFLRQAFLYPNIILFITPILLIDIYFHSRVSIWLFSIWSCYFMLIIAKLVIQKIKFMYYAQ